MYLRLYSRRYIQEYSLKMSGLGKFQFKIYTGWPPVFECTGMYFDVLKWKMYWKMYWKSPFLCTGKILYWKI